MPFVSQAQRGKFYATPSLRKYIPEFEAATPKGAKLPYRAGQSQPNLQRLAVSLARRKRRHGTQQF